jgi:hypothetical protein
MGKAMNQDEIIQINKEFFAHWVGPEADRNFLKFLEECKTGLEKLSMPARRLAMVGHEAINSVAAEYVQPDNVAEARFRFAFFFVHVPEPLKELIHRVDPGCIRTARYFFKQGIEHKVPWLRPLASSSPAATSE